ncbi:Anaphase-promoting complex subunit 4 [Mortierella sp. 14UC]|nr:Anaphase-promoting complex subunit 4 [Mortierella sp. 14UC]
MDPMHTLAPQESAQNTFYSYSENHVPINHKLEAWCPAADLIALVNDDNKLELYRLSWRLHWSVSVKTVPPSGSNTRPGTHSTSSRPGGILQQQRPGSAPAKVVSLAWRKAIAVGLADGGVNIYDYRDGSLISSIQLVGPGAIHCLKWTDIHLGTPNYSSIFGTNNTQISTLKVLPMLSPIPATSVQQQIMERTMFNKTILGGAGTGGNKSAPSPEESCNVLDEESSPIMNVLLSGDHQGRLMLRLFEGFDMDTVSLSDLLRTYGSGSYKDDLDILKADIQLDLSEITVLACGTHIKEGSDAEPSRRLIQVTLNSRLLDNHSQEIRMLGLHKRPMKNLLQYLNDGLQVMKADYNKISQMAEDCVESLQRALSSNNVKTTPTYEFIQMLLTGRPSETMVQFLEKELNTHDLKRWDKSVKAAYKNLQRVAFECLLPACERLLVILSDSLGCSRWTEQYGPLRLEETLVYNCIIIVGDFLGEIEGLFQAIKVELKQFIEFENWLEQVLEKLHPPARGPDDPADEGPKVFPLVDVKGVSQYLKAGLANNGIARFFQEAGVNLTTHGIQENTGLSDGSTGMVNKEEALMQSYTAIPSYPIIYSFSDDLRAASAVKSNVSDNLSPLQKKPTNPFAGAAIAAAMAGRGFGSMPSKKSPSATLFTKSSSSTVQPPKTVTIDGPGSPTGPPSMRLTLERHLALMTKRCLSIFQEPQKALAESMNVVHVMEVLEYESVAPDDSVMENTEKTEAQAVPKFATRYSYHHDKPAEQSGFGESVIEQDMEVAIFSLQEHDSAQAPVALPDEFHDQDKTGVSKKMMATNNAESALALAKMQSPPTSEPRQPFFEVRDLTFLDDDSLCVLLNSSRLTTGAGTSARADSAQDDQFVVSVPLLTPSRPYQSLPTLLAPLTPPDAPWDSVLNRLIHALKARSRDGQVAISSSHNAAVAINVYTLPIDRSRCVTPLDGQSAMDVDGASRSLSFLKSTSETILDTREQQQQRDGQTRGPTRIACNDREKGQVISVHSHNKINVLDVLS